MRTIGQYFSAILIIDIKKVRNVIEPKSRVTIIAAKIDVSETAIKLNLSALFRKSIRKLIPIINNTAGKIISLLFVNSKLLIRKRSSPVRKSEEPINKTPSCFLPKEV